MITDLKKIRLLLISAGLSVLLFFYPLFTLFSPLPLIYYFLSQDSETKPFKTILLFSSLFAFCFSFGVFYFQGSDAKQAQNQLSALFNFFIFDPEIQGLLIQSLVFTAIYFVHALVGCLIGLSFQSHPLKFTKTTLKNVGYLCLVLVGLTSLFVLWKHNELFTEFKTAMEANIDGFVKDYEEAGFSVQQIIEMKSLYPKITEVVFYLFPIGIIFSVWSIYFFNLIIAKSFFTAKWKKLLFYTLLDFKVRFEWVWAFLLSALGLAAAYRFAWPNPVFATFINTTLLFSGLYLMQGLAVVFYYMNAKQIFGFTRLLVFIAFLFLPQFSFVLLTVIGLADNWKDFRVKIQEQIKNENS